MFAKIGRITITTTQDAGAYAGLVARTIAAVFRPPFEWKAFIKQLEVNGVRSLPVVAVTCLFTGMVFALQTYEGFRRFEAEAYVPGVLGLALLRELVPVLSGLMVAGRVGSAMAAELGTMKVTDQIAALEAMATDPIRYLVVPRVLATILMVPLLVALGDLIGLLGGWYLIETVLGYPMPGFMDRVFDIVENKDFWSGFIKAGFFGGIVASVGCFRGLTVMKGAEGVGVGTTSAVVNASLGILISDFFLSKVLF